MAITIVADEKISEKARQVIARGGSIDLCIKSAACRVGLPAYAWKNTAGLASPDINKILTFPGVEKIEVLQYLKYCEPTKILTPNGEIIVNAGTHCTARSIEEAFEVIRRGACGGKPCDPNNPLGGWPPAKGIIQQILEGVKELLTKNPAILMCLSMQGIRCPLIDWLTKVLPASAVEALRLAWLNYGCSEFIKQFVNVTQQHDVDFSGLVNKYICGQAQDRSQNPQLPYDPVSSQLPTGRRGEVIIAINDVVTAKVPVQELSDGSWAFYDRDINFIGRTSLTINFSSCTAEVKNQYISGLHAGRSVGTNECLFEISGYKIRVKLILERNGRQPGTDDGTITIPGLNITLNKDQAFILFGSVFLLIVGLILISRR